MIGSQQQYKITDNRGRQSKSFVSHFALSCDRSPCLSIIPDSLDTSTDSPQPTHKGISRQEDHAKRSARNSARHDTAQGQVQTVESLPDYSQNSAYIATDVSSLQIWLWPRVCKMGRTQRKSCCLLTLPFMVSSAKSGTQVVLALTRAVKLQLDHVTHTYTCAMSVISQPSKPDGKNVMIKLPQLLYS